MIKYNLCIFLCFLTTVAITGQSLSGDQLDQLAFKFAKGSFPTLKELLEIPNDAHFHDDIEKNIPIPFLGSLAILSNSAVIEMRDGKLLIS